MEKTKEKAPKNYLFCWRLKGTDYLYWRDGKNKSECEKKLREDENLKGKMLECIFDSKKRRKRLKEEISCE